MKLTPFYLYCIVNGRISKNSQYSNHYNSYIIQEWITGTIQEPLTEIIFCPRICDAEIRFLYVFQEFITAKEVVGILSLFLFYRNNMYQREFQRQGFLDNSYNSLLNDISITVKRKWIHVKPVHNPKRRVRDIQSTSSDKIDLVYRQCIHYICF